MYIQPIIFLDVDGPINTTTNITNRVRERKPTSSYKVELPSYQLRNLSRIVSVTRSKIVLSSSWRLVDRRYVTGNISPARANLESQLNKFGMSIFSQTPYVNGDRGLEITTWLNRYKSKYGFIPPYIIIDDKLDPIIKHHKGHVILCNPRLGITTELSNIAIQVLNNLCNKYVP